MDPKSWTQNFVIENENQCKELFKNEDVWDKVPLLNSNDLHDFKDNSLIRFRGMIQDMHNPEFYIEKFEVENKNGEKLMKNGKYMDAADISENDTILFKSPKNVTSGRQTYVIISLPGVNSWVHHIEKETNVLPEKPSASNVSNNSSQTKRALEDEEMETEPCPSASESDVKTDSGTKKLCTNPGNSSSQSQPSVVSNKHILNFPLSEENGKCCHVKMYNDNESLKLNEMIDVIGFLSVDPSLTDLSYHNEEDSQMEIQTLHPPPSLVPRIHCISFRKIKDCNPLSKTTPITQEQLPNLRKELSIVLTQLLMGDELSADYLICHLVSSVYLRKELLTLGKFCLNISNIPAVKYPNYGEELYEILEMLLPKSHYLPMTLDNMNSLSFIPKKDYDCNRLTSGILQLSSNTHLILDETRMQPGKLNESGCRGIAALSSTIKNQKVNYDFNYYQMEYECDIPFLVLSEGKSLLPSDFHVPMLPDDQHMNTFAEIKEASKHFLKLDLLNNIRTYISKVRHSKYELPESTMELVQSEFVKMRQNAKITGDDLHQLLVLARLVCLSLGKTSLDQECWYKACEMENKRKERLIAKINAPEP